MGQGHDSSRLTLARVEQLAQDIKDIGKRARARRFVDSSDVYPYMCGSLEAVLDQLVRETCGGNAAFLIAAAFREAYTGTSAAAPVDQPAQVAL